VPAGELYAGKQLAYKLVPQINKLLGLEAINRYGICPGLFFFGVFTAYYLLTRGVDVCVVGMVRIITP